MVFTSTNVKRLRFLCVGVFWQCDYYFVKFFYQFFFSRGREYITWLSVEWLVIIYFFFNFICLFKYKKKQIFWVIELQGLADVWDVIKWAQWVVPFVWFSFYFCCLFDLRRKREIQFCGTSMGLFLVFDTQVWCLYVPF